MTAPLPWHSAVRDILGMQDDVDPVRVTDKNWIVLDATFTGTTEQEGQSPWDHWMPQGPGQGNWNEITLYRWRRVDMTAPPVGAVDKTVKFFQLIRANVPFYGGTQGDGKDSPSTQANLLINANQSIISNVGSNQYLDPAMFKEVATRFWNVWSYLVGKGQTQLQSMYKEIDDSGVAEGDAADAFSWAMHDMALGMTNLAVNIEGSGESTNWTSQLNATATAVDVFKQAMTAAWNAFLAYQHHNPNTLVDALLKSMERQADDAWNKAKENSGNTGNAQEPWYFDFGDVLTRGTSTYDLIQPAEWTRLNLDVMYQWKYNWYDLDIKSRDATTKLMTAYDNLLKILSRGVNTLTHEPYPGPNSPGDQGLNQPPPSQNGGSNGDLPPADGGGSEVPPPDSGGSNAALPPPQSGGSDSLVSGSDFGGGPDSLGLDGATPPPNSLVSGSNFGGGPDSAGLDGFGSGFNDLGGSGGFNGPGLGGPGLNGPGLVGTGPVIGGLVGAGGSGPGASSGSDSRRPGVVGAGFDDLESGAAIGGASDTPFPLDPNTVGGGGFNGLDPNAVGAGGFNGLDPSRLGTGSGFNLGPLGTPPPGYVPTPIANLPASAVAGGTFASGGPDIGGLSGSIGNPTPPPDAGIGASDGMGGLGGMPYLPAMGGPGGRDNEKERERSTWLTEEEDLWGLDPEVTAAVIGRQDHAPAPDATPGRRPSQPRQPQPTYEPTRERGNG